MTLDEWKECEIEADRRMKASNGHRFITILKTRCEHCRRKPDVKTRCGWWFETFRTHLIEVLMNRGFVGSAAQQSEKKEAGE